MRSLLNLTVKDKKMGVVRPVSQRRSIKKKVKPYSKTQRKSTGRTNALVKAPRIMGLGPSDFGFPDRIATKLLYGDVISISLASGAANYNTFRMNGLQDPDLTGFGHQPQWFDQFAAVYRNYRVKGAKITVNFFSGWLDYSGHEAGPYLVGVTTNDQTTLSASSNASLTEDANGVNQIITPKPGMKSICTLSNTFSPMKDLGVDPYDDTISALTGNNPGRAFYAHVWAKDIGSATTSAVQAQVKIEFQVEFFNRIEGVLS